MKNKFLLNFILIVFLNLHLNATNEADVSSKNNITKNITNKIFYISGLGVLFLGGSVAGYFSMVKFFKNKDDKKIKNIEDIYLNSEQILKIDKVEFEDALNKITKIEEKMKNELERETETDKKLKLFKDCNDELSKILKIYDKISDKKDLDAQTVKFKLSEIDVEIKKIKTVIKDALKNKK